MSQEGYIPNEEVAVLTAAIKFIKKRWCSPGCKKERIQTIGEGRCQSCMAWDVIEFLQKSIEYAKEDAKD